MLGWIFHTLVLLAAANWLLPHFLLFLRAHGRIEESYNGKQLPCGLGVFVWMLIWLQELLLSLYEALFPGGPLHSALLKDNELFVLASTIVCALGWTDDTIGHKSVKGMKGHWKYWISQRTVSMGMVKAFGTAAVSVWVLLKLGQGTIVFVPFIVNLLLMLLMTNSMNLLDLRPGRALKAFLIFAVILILTKGSTEVLALMLPVLVGALLLFPHDLRGNLMLGDTGANLLGFSMGFWFVLWGDLWQQLLLVASCTGMHVIAEYGSISRVIAKNRILNWLDRIGRA